MNDQSQMMNQAPKMMNQPSQVPVMSQPPPQLLNQKPQIMSHHPQLMINHSQSQMMNQRSYGMWPPAPPQTRMEMNFPNPMNQKVFIGSNTRNWKGKKGNDKRKDGRRKEKPAIAGAGSSSGTGYRPPTLNELQHQNRMKAKRFFNPKKKYNNRFAPYAPRNTTSFLIRAKKSGGIASLVSPCPVTPAVLPTPIFSPSREVLGDMAKEEWGVDGYGSMKGLIRLRSPGNEADAHEDEEDEEGGSSDSDVEEHVEVERRLDHDLSRFEMIYPNYGGDYNNVLENRVDDQDSHIAHLEEENLILKERLFLMEREMSDLRRRLQYLERHNHVAEEINEEVVDNVSENDSESRDDGHSTEGHNEYNREEGDEEVNGKEQHTYEAPENDHVRDVCMDGFAHGQHEVISGNQSKDEGVENCCIEKSSGVNDDVSMDGLTNVPLDVTVEEDQPKNAEVKNEC